MFALQIFLFSLILFICILLFSREKLLEIYFFISIIYIWVLLTSVLSAMVKGSGGRSFILEM